MIPLCVRTAADDLMGAIETLGERAARLEKDRDQLHASRALWIRCFNRLEKAVTNHIHDCIDGDELAHVHRVVLRDLGPNPGESA